MRYPVTIVMAVAALTAAASSAAAETPAPGSSQEVYVYTGEHGELAFSDVAHPGAERVALPPAPASAEDVQEELERRIERTLKVANALEQSRLAREKARAQARAAAARAREPTAPVVVYQDRYVTSPYVTSPYGALPYGASPFPFGTPAHRFARGHEHRIDARKHRAHPGREGRREERTLHETFFYDRH